jgi:hypothetical protein
MSCPPTHHRQRCGELFAAEAVLYMAAARPIRPAGISAQQASNGATSAWEATRFNATGKTL